MVRHVPDELFRFYVILNFKLCMFGEPTNVRGLAIESLYKAIDECARRADAECWKFCVYT